MKKKVILITLGAAAFAALETEAKVVPATPFSDNMVLQRGMAVPVWGTADAGESVTVSFAGQEKTVTADASGKWFVALDPMVASKENRTMRITGGRTSPRAATIEINNVLVGERTVEHGVSYLGTEHALPRREGRGDDGHDAATLHPLCQEPEAVGS